MLTAKTYIIVMGLVILVASIIGIIGTRWAIKEEVKEKMKEKERS